MNIDDEELKDEALSMGFTNLTKFARYRVLLKRDLRSRGIWFDREYDTATLEKLWRKK